MGQPTLVEDKKFEEKSEDIEDKKFEEKSEDV